MLKETALLELLRSHPFFFWMAILLVLLRIADGIILLIWKKALSDLPGSVKVCLAVILSAALIPLACDAAYHLLNGEIAAIAPDNPWGLKRWPATAVAGFVGVLTAILAYTLNEFWEPAKDELLVHVPPWLEYLTTWFVGALLSGVSLAIFAFMVSVRREVSYFAVDYLGLLAGLWFGPALMTSLWLRTQGCPRYLAEVLTFSGAGGLTYWLVLRERSPETTVVLLATCVVWFLLAGIRATTSLIRARGSDANEGHSPAPPVPTDANLHRCEFCDREFLTYRGLRIHQGRAHRSPLLTD